ncbi:Chemotaxis regulator CheZ, phosphatase of CheY~P [Nitrosomonas sp. Nm51]|uniref:protein phosphatase CheZ n=1 Tax=Nitrosomonas sp. Nm51 TaxID=133720 RepID=UPI0008C241E5|nr:protein phosphatase CheZ [Nitrosomonas sp. Nm51]SER78614.1 Chemotaxis regulator CheZ, phosphatase of CheY~P [Nitrosomonas sp. Nm51]
MQPSDIMHDESELTEMNIYAEVRSAKQLTDTVSVLLEEDSFEQNIIGNLSCKENQNNTELVDSYELMTSSVTETNIDTAESEYAVLSELVSQEIVTVNQNGQSIDSIMVNDDLDGSESMIETETAKETFSQIEPVNEDILVNQDSKTDCLSETKIRSEQDFVSSDDVPETVLMQVVDEMTHASSENTQDETVSSDATEKPSSMEKNVIDQVGHLTRNLHNSLRELGYDKRLESLASEVPGAQDKLTYVVTKTKQAAERVISATEITMPIQEKLSLDASQLSEKWKLAFEEQRVQPDTEKFKQLLIETLSFVDKVPEQADATNAQLMEIMMAQDFQDLTGQVIKKITYMVQRLEHDLVQLLLANVPVTKQISSNDELMNGPVTNPEKSPDTVSSQDQVDDLLASLGF